MAQAVEPRMPRMPRIKWKTFLPLRSLHCCTVKASRAATNSQTGLATKRHEEFLRFGPVPIAPIGAQETPSAAPGSFLCLFVATPPGFGCGSAALCSLAADPDWLHAEYAGNAEDQTDLGNADPR
jgi:hypothetical protein